MGRAIGIDLGTTYSAAAIMQADGKPAILPNSEGQNITPSVVLFPDVGNGNFSSGCSSVCKETDG